jgi:hypothetical protein
MGFEATHVEFESRCACMHGLDGVEVAARVYIYFTVWESFISKAELHFRSPAWDVQSFAFQHRSFKVSLSGMCRLKFRLDKHFASMHR